MPRSEGPSRWPVLAANLLWVLAALPGLARFLAAALAPRWAQRRLLRRALASAEGSAQARALGLTGTTWPADLRIQGPAGLEPWVARILRGEPAVLGREAVLCLAPTSGSASASRWVPYTEGLKRQFQAAVDPWIALQCLAAPGLLLGRHYWSISPATPYPVSGAVPVGFGEDTQYLGAWQRRAAARVLAVPPEAARARAGFERGTLLYLLAARDLAFISVWSPTFLLGLLEALPRHHGAILAALESGVLPEGLGLESAALERLQRGFVPLPRRARELATLDCGDPSSWRRLWPRLRVISCWNDGPSAAEAARLAALFPEARLQAKGLMATEAVVSLPLGLSGRKVLAAASHYFEFVDVESGRLRRAWELETGRDYRVLVTTTGGLLRYDLRDRVRVSGWWLRLPCLEFLGRADLVSDLVGEKLNARHVADCIGAACGELALAPAFAMLAPRLDGGRRRYCLHIQASGLGPEAVARLTTALEQGLAGNYHYRHARALGQLAPVEACVVAGAPATDVLRRAVEAGRRAGDVKLEALSREDAWEQVFTPERAAA